MTIASGVVIEKLCEYLYYNLKHQGSKDVPDMEIPPNLCLELLMAADYFDGMYIVLRFWGYAGADDMLMLLVVV